MTNSSLASTLTDSDFGQCGFISSEIRGRLAVRFSLTDWNNGRGKGVHSIPWSNLFKGWRIEYHYLTLTQERKARSIR